MPPSYACDGIVNLLSLGKLDPLGPGLFLATSFSMKTQLTLENNPDGGGVRGVCELVILDKIMTRIQERDGLDEIPKPCDYFHLIGGTSTGG